MKDPEQSKNTVAFREDTPLLDQESPEPAATELNSQSDMRVKSPGFLQRIFHMVFFLARHSQSENDPNTIIPKLDDFPLGYPRLAALVDSDPNYVEYRRYGYLRHRCLLSMQDELAELEQELSTIDADDGTADPKRLMCRFRDNAKSSRRGELLLDIKSKIREYDELLFRTRESMHWDRPTPRNRRSYARFINNSKFLLRNEDEFIKYSEDLVALGGDLDNSWLNGAVADSMFAASKPLSKFLFQSEVDRKRTNEEYVIYCSKSRLDFFIRLIMTLLCAFLLMSPVFMLKWLQQAEHTIDIVVLGSTLLCAICLAIFTKAKRHELFVASAGYCAILMLFFSNSIISRGYRSSTSDGGAL